MGIPKNGKIPEFSENSINAGNSQKSNILGGFQYLINSENPNKFQKIQINSGKFRKIQENSEKFRKIKINSNKFREIQENSNKFR